MAAHQTTAVSELARAAVPAVTPVEEEAAQVAAVDYAVRPPPLRVATREAAGAGVIAVAILLAFVVTMCYPMQLHPARASLLSLVYTHVYTYVYTYVYAYAKARASLLSLFYTYVYTCVYTYVYT